MWGHNLFSNSMGYDHKWNGYQDKIQSSTRGKAIIISFSQFLCLFASPLGHSLVQDSKLRYEFPARLLSLFLSGSRVRTTSLATSLPIRVTLDEKDWFTSRSTRAASNSLLSLTKGPTFFTLSPMEFNSFFQEGNSRSLSSFYFSVISRICLSFSSLAAFGWVTMFLSFGRLSF